MTDAATIDTRKEAESKGGESLYWQQQLDLSDKDHEDFIKAGREVQDRYKGEQKAKLKRSNKRFNILYSNVETLKAAIFVKMAKPDVRRRFSDQDPIGRAVAEVVERGIIYCDDSYDAEKEIEAGIEDYLIPGRSVVRVVYEADTDGKVVTEQELKLEHVYWEDFRHEPARRWCKIGWIAFRHKMSRDALIANFGDLGREAPLNWSPEPDNDRLPDAFKRAEVWEIWDQSERKRIWVVKGFAKVLRTDDDPYGLEDFYPMAEPLQGTTTTRTFIPEPEFHIYRDQADGLDEIEDRIDRLTRALKRRGVYDATFKELERLSRANDNQFIPVKNYADLSTKGGLAAAFQSEDLTQIAAVLKELHAQRDLRVQTIYEVVGIADIMRGATDPKETLGAQQLKAQFGGNRLKKRQDRVQKWIRDTLRLKAEILAEHFQPEKLQEMTGLPLNPLTAQDPQMAQQAVEIIKVLRSDKLRSYRIDIETDSTIFEDAQEQKQSTVELLTALSAFLEKAVMAGGQAPELMPLMFEMLSLGLRAFKAGRSLEDVLEQTKVQVMERLAQVQANPQPDPKVEAEKIKAEAVKQKTELDGQVAQMKAENERQKMVLDMQATQQKHSMEMEKMQAELAMMREQLGMKAQEMQIEAQIDAQRLDHEAQSMEMQQQAAERDHERSQEAGEAKHKQTMAAMKAKRKEPA